MSNGEKISDLKAEALGLYRPPFRYVHGYIYDSQNNMVADESGHCLRVRGWGRISYLKNPEALQDAVGEYIAAALTEYWQHQTHNLAGR